MTRKNKIKSRKHVELDPAVWNKMKCKFLKGTLLCSSAPDAVRRLTVSKKVKQFIEENRGVMPRLNLKSSISFNFLDRGMIAFAGSAVNVEDELIALPFSKCIHVVGEEEELYSFFKRTPSKAFFDKSHKRTSWFRATDDWETTLMTLVKQLFAWYKCGVMSQTDSVTEMFRVLNRALRLAIAPDDRHFVTIVHQSRKEMDEEEKVGFLRQVFNAMAGGDACGGVMLDEHHIEEQAVILNSTNVVIHGGSHQLRPNFVDAPFIQNLTSLSLVGCCIALRAPHLSALKHLKKLVVNGCGAEITPRELHCLTICPWQNGDWSQLEELRFRLIILGMRRQDIRPTLVGHLPKRGKFYRDIADTKKLRLDVLHIDPLGYDCVIDIRIS